MPAATEADSSDTESDSDEAGAKTKKSHKIEKRDVKKKKTDGESDNSSDCDFSTTQTVMEQKLFLRNKAIDGLHVDHSLFKIIHGKGRSGDYEIGVYIIYILYNHHNFFIS